MLYKHVICCYELEEQICIPSSHIIVYICHGGSVILIVCTQTLRDIVLVYRSVCSKLERKFCCINPDTGEKIGKTTSLQLQHMKFVYILTTFVVFIDCRISKQETKQFSPAVFVGGNLDCYLHRWEIHMYCLMVQFD